MATIDATSASGYAQMNVEDIVRGAGVSRRTFYELFANKHDAFLAAFDAAADALLAAVRSATERETTFEGKVIAGVRAFLEALAATPGPARVCIVEALAAGPDAIARRTEVMGTFARLIDDQAAAPRSARDHRGGARRRHLRGDLPPDRRRPRRRPPGARAGPDRADADAVRRRGDTPVGCAQAA